MERVSGQGVLSCTLVFKLLRDMPSSTTRSGARREGKVGKSLKKVKRGIG